MDSLKSIQKLFVMTKLPGSSLTVVFVLRTKAIANTILEHYLQTMLTKTVRILRTGSTHTETDQKGRGVEHCGRRIAATKTGPRTDLTSLGWIL